MKLIQILIWIVAERDVYTSIIFSNIDRRTSGSNSQSL